MDKEQIIKTIQEAKKNSPKRNFKQSIELIINLKDYDIKKNTLNSFISLPFPAGKKVKVCALVGPELIEHAKKTCDNAIPDEEFSKYSEKKTARALAQSYDYFIAQVTIMPKIATVFGKVFGPKGKMPNPKAGCVVPPNANLKPLCEKLQTLVNLRIKNNPIFQIRVGTEDSKEEEIAANVAAIYENLIHSMPNGEDNIKNMLLKLTMSPSFQIGKKKEAAEEKKHAKKAKKKPSEEKKEEPETEIKK